MSRLILTTRYNYAHLPALVWTSTFPHNEIWISLVGICSSLWLTIGFLQILPRGGKICTFVSLASQMHGSLHRFRFPSDTLVIPFVVALSLSAVHILYTLVVSLKSWKGLNQNIATSEDEQPNHSRTFSQVIRARAKEHGGWTIFLFAAARLIGCVTLLVLSSITLSRHFDGIESGTTPFRLLVQYPEFYMFLTFVRLLHVWNSRVLII